MPKITSSPVAPPPTTTSKPQTTAAQPQSAPAENKGWQPAAGTSNRSTIWRKLESFDTHPKDGKLDFQETKAVFDKVGLPSYWSFASALATAINRGPIGRGKVTLDDLKHPHKLLEITLSDIQDSLLKGQSGVFDKNANADPAKAEAFYNSVKRPDGTVTLEKLRDACEKSATDSVAGMSEPAKSLERKKNFGEAYSAWVQLMEVAGHTGTDGVKSLTKEQVQSVFNGTMFDMIFAGKKDQEKISVMNIVTELLGKTLTA